MWSLIAFGGLIVTVIGLIGVLRPIRALGVPTRGRGGLAVLLGFVVLVFGANMDQRGKPPRRAATPASPSPVTVVETSSPAPRPQPTPRTPDPQAERTDTLVAISARQLFVAFDDNEIAANRTYNGTRLIVTGTVGEIGTDFLGHAYLTLDAADDSLFSVHAMFGRDEAQMRQLAALSKGVEVSATCTVSGKMLGSVVVNKCALSR